MKRILLTALTTLTAIIMNAATLGMPAGELKSITYRVGGGMLPYDQAYNNLAKGDDGQWVLTNKGISPGETVSIVVPDSVAERCLKIMEEQKLYLSQGTYPYDREHIVLDAPSTNFSAVFINRTPGAKKKFAFIDASGDIPENIRNGISVLTDYLDSFTKGIKAPGHLDRLYGDAKPTATKFSDGRDFTFDAEADDLTEFFKKCNADALNENFHEASWHSSFYRDNDGIEYLYVSNSGIEYNNSLPQVDKVPKSPMIPLIQGLYTDEAGKYAGCGVKDANPEITHDLYHHDALLKEGTIDHRVGLCWRCKTPIIYIATKQWFIKVTEIKDQMLEQVDAVEWVPSWAGESRFKDWVSNARDWTISRQRYWGIPIPIWTCEECDSKVVVGSKQELKELSGDDTLTGDFVHRPHVDNITIPCECGHDMHRVPDVLDVWIDSGVAGWAALHYPQDPSENFEDWFPYDFITEGHDQTRGWFYSQLGLGVAAFGKAPYKKVLMHGFTLDDKGQKMSKSIGNVVSPEEVIEKYSADTLRFYLLDANKPWDDLKFNWDEVQNSSKLFNILWNVYYFSTTYMSLDNFDPTAHNKEDLTFRQEDLWIRSRVNTLIKSVSEDIESLVFNRATEKITEFVLEDLSRWYVRLIRGRTWVESDDPDKLGAYYTLYYTLKDLIRVLAPIAPHVTEEIYQNLVRGVECDAPESVHMLDWEYDETEIDTDLEENMTHIRDILEASAHARDVARFKLRWPVQNITVVTESDEVKSAIESLEPVLLEQANSKKVTIETELENAIVIAKPNMSILGPKLRGDLGRVKKYFEQDDVDAGIILDEVTQNGEYTIHFDDKDITLVEEEILFEKDVPENLVSCDFEGGSVYVDTEVTPEIYSEAMARELIRRIQDMRKDLDLNVEANIQVIVECSEEFKDTVLPHQDYISNEVRTANLEFDDISSDEGYTKEWKIEEEQLRIFIKE